MTHTELRQAAIDYLGQALKSDSSQPAPLTHVVQAAISILLSPAPKQKS